MIYKYTISMIILKLDDVVKKVKELRLLFGYFFKYIIYYHISAEFHNHGLTSSGFMARGAFGPIADSLMSK